MTESVDQIHAKISQMGYITATPSKPLEPSFYELTDGSILSLISKVNYLVVDSNDSEKIHLNFTNHINVFVEKSKRKLPTKTSTNKSLTVLEEDLEYIPLVEKFNEYILSNGDIMNVRSILSTVDKLDTFSSTGEPAYLVTAQPIIKVKRKPRD